MTSMQAHLDAMRRLQKLQTPSWQTESEAPRPPTPIHVAVPTLDTRLDTTAPSTAVRGGS